MTVRFFFLVLRRLVRNDCGSVPNDCESHSVKRGCWLGNDDGRGIELEGPCSANGGGSKVMAVEAGLTRELFTESAVERGNSVSSRGVDADVPHPGVLRVAASSFPTRLRLNRCLRQLFPPVEGVVRLVHHRE